MKRLEDRRHELVVIIAGYPDEMETFLHANPGVKSRFNRLIEFPHYMPDGLYRIFHNLCETSHYKLSKPANAALIAEIGGVWKERDRTFGNARLVRNLFERAVQRHARRVAAGVWPRPRKCS